MSETDLYNINILGYCEKNTQEILTQIKNSYKNSPNLNALRGNYVIIVEHKNKLTIYTSVICNVRYYYALTGGSFYHGETILGVAKKSGIGLKWNFSALADIFSFGHLLDHSTTILGVYSVPPNSIIEYQDTTGLKTIFPDVKDCSLRFYNQEELLHIPSNIVPGNNIIRPKDVYSKMSSKEIADRAIEALQSEIDLWASDNSIICMTGGFDSRLILGCFLSLKKSLCCLLVGKKTLLILLLVKKLRVNTA